MTNDPRPRLYRFNMTHKGPSIHKLRFTLVNLPKDGIPAILAGSVSGFQPIRVTSRRKLAGRRREKGERARGLLRAGGKRRVSAGYSDVN